MDSRRFAAFGLLVASNLLWSGNWVIGRAVRDVFDPVALNWWRWLVAALVMAPFGMREALRHADAVRRHAGLFLLLAMTGVVAFQSLVYLGLRTTTAINAVLINAAGPLFMILCSWLLERDKPSRRQIAGMLISFLGVLIVVSRGHLQTVLQLEFHRGDAWILIAMPMWGLYSVLLRRAPAELRGVAFAFTIAAIGVGLLLPLYAIDLWRGPWRSPTWAEVGVVLYIGIAASVLAFIAWNRGVTVVGANAAGFTLPLLPAFGTALAIAFLGEVFQAFHAVGFVTIVIGVVLATFRRS
jgi:drug/metabolite transporter (DMT)-like permease